MTWDERLDKIQKVGDLMVKYEIHAFLLIGLGVVMGRFDKAQGTALITLGAGVFKGNR